MQCLAANFLAFQSTTDTRKSSQGVPEVWMASKPTAGTAAGPGEERCSIEEHGWHDKESGEEEQGKPRAFNTSTR